MEDKKSISNPRKNKWFHIIITQAVCVSIILIGILITKYFFKSTYKDIKEWYEINIQNDTDINEVLSDGGINEI